MKKDYLEPQLLIRKYGISANIFTNSPGSLDDDDEFTKQSSGNGSADMFKD